MSDVRCVECGSPDGNSADWDMCPECLHDALRSGWVPGDES